MHEMSTDLETIFWLLLVLGFVYVLKPKIPRKFSFFFFNIIIPFVDSVLVFLLLDPSGDSFFGIIELHSWVSSCFAGEIRSRNSALERSLRRLFLLS